MVYLSVIIPAYNEEKRLGPSLRTVLSYLNKQEYKSELIIVDDGSTDNTLKIVEQLKTGNVDKKIVRNNRNMGKGYSVNVGVQNAEGEYILFSDADLSTPITEVEQFFPYLNDGYDVVIGSRGLPDSDIKVHQPKYREWMGKRFGSITRMIVLPGIQDSQCGFKCFARSSAQKIFKKQKLHGFSFDVEVLFITRKLNYRIKEIPITWENSSDTKVRAIRDATRMFIDLFRIQYFNLLGSYNDEQGT